MRVAAEHSPKRQNAEKLAAKTPILSGFLSAMGCLWKNGR
jgi:hypothetical protein